MRSLAMQALTDDYEREYPGITVWGKGDDDHAQRTSDHNEDDTDGVKAAQEDADDIPEHRALDVKVDGVAFNHEQAIASINEVLAQAHNRRRLRYVNYQNLQWHVDDDFIPHDNSDDPHPTHIHYSQLASADDDATPWFGAEMDQNDRNTAHADTWRLLTILQNEDAAQYQLVGEPKPRNEPNLLKVELQKILDKVSAPAPVVITDVQITSLARQIAEHLAPAMGPAVLGPMAAAFRAAAAALESPADGER